ncbi:maleate cis-trans isomerase family protein [Aquibaculum sediminis]|uniref:maleate cis-trans isomerase family protein n=1 Tax=Aquibaculum sediminis TaxID=3231907 RepID=UPI003451CD8B
MHLPYTLADSQAPGRVALGLIVLGVDETVEEDFRRLLPFDAARLYHTRIESGSDLTPDSIAAMSQRLTASAALLPAHAGLGAIGYACTSGATLLGEARVAALIAEARPAVPVTDPMTALKAACRSLGIRRLGLVSPYIRSVSEVLLHGLKVAGIAVPAFGSFDQQEERVVARIAPASIREALLRIGGEDDCEAVFASCTNLQAVEVLAEVRERLGKPVLASNQVLAWHMLQLAGLSRPQLLDSGNSGTRVARA